MDTSVGAILKNNNPKVIRKNWEREYREVPDWTRSKVQQEIFDVMMFVLKSGVDSPEVQMMTTGWPDNCSVRWEWVKSVIKQLKPKTSYSLPGNTADVMQFSLVFTKWLDKVDSTTDRKILILAGAEMSMEKIGNLIGMHRQTVSRRHTKALDMLAWDLNRPKNIKRR
jgi:hypothetical protein